MLTLGKPTLVGHTNQLATEPYQYPIEQPDRKTLAGHYVRLNRGNAGKPWYIDCPDNSLLGYFETEHKAIESLNDRLDGGVSCCSATAHLARARTGPGFVTSRP
jgi:hypothetical protein